MNYYNPDTLEYIPTPLPKTKEWAGVTDIAVPVYDTTTEQLKFINGAWVVEALPPAPVEVYSCSPWQIRKALNDAGLRDQVEQMILDTTNYAIKDGWEYTTIFKSDDPFVQDLGMQLGMDEAGIAEFIRGAQSL